MSANRTRIGLFLLAAGLFGCGGTIKGNNGPDGATTTIPCSAMGACECMAASDRCAARTEACYCPTACDPQIACICGGGRFLGCESKTVTAACTTELANVQAKCATTAFVSYISNLCTTAADPTCVAGCLSNLNMGGSCSEIDCSFCTACDCAGPPTPSPFTACLRACAPPPPNLD